MAAGNGGLIEGGGREHHGCLSMLTLDHTDSTRVEESTTTTTFANFSSAEITS